MRVAAYVVLWAAAVTVAAALWAAAAFAAPQKCAPADAAARLMWGAHKEVVIETLADTMGEDPVTWQLWANAVTGAWSLTVTGQTEHGMMTCMMSHGEDYRGRTIMGIRFNRQEL